MNLSPRSHRIVPSIFSGRPLEQGERVTIAVLIGVASGIAAAVSFGTLPEMLARDFTYPWRGAQALLAGQNPYEVIRPIGSAPFDMWFMYPLTAALAVLPLALLPVQVAGVLFVSLGAALLTYVLSAQGMGRLWLLLSVPFGMSVVLAQWAPLLIAAAFLTPLAWLLTCKPIGLALFIAYPRWRAAALCAVMVILAFVIQPHWLGEWLRNAETVTQHNAPLRHPIGMLALLALVRWRRPEARLVGTMVLIPQLLDFYDQLPLLLVARTGRAAFVMTALTWVAWGVTSFRCHSAYFCGPEATVPILALIYVPATIVVLADGETREMVALRWTAWRLGRRAQRVEHQRADD